MARVKPESLQLSRASAWAICDAFVRVADPSPFVAPLTPCEFQILHLLADGLTNQEIAQELILSIGSVKTHVHRICGKLGTNNRTQAVAQARRYGLL